MLAAAAARLDAVAGVDPDLDTLAERMRAIVLESGDLAAELRDYGERLAGEDGSLEEIEQRLAATERLIRKHGGSIADVLAYAAQARARREELDGAEVAFTQTAERLSSARAELDRHVAQLRQAASWPPRSWPAPCASSSPRSRWPMPTLRSSSPSAPPVPAVQTQVELMIAPNPGVPAGPSA